MKAPLILIHAFPLEGRMWTPQVTALGGSRAVAAPDLPGFGHAKPWLRGQCSMEAYAEEIYRVVRSMPGAEGGNAPGAVVGGSSMGGYVALALARAHPEAVRGLILLDTRADTDTIEARANRLRSMDEVAARGVEAIVEPMLGRVLSRHATPELRAQVGDMMRRQTPEGVMGAQYAMARRRDQTDLLATIKVPTLLIVGAEDALTPPAVMEGMRRQMADAMLVQVERAGHLVNMEAPGVVTEVMERFMERV